MATRFYQELFARDPALRPLFATDLAEQEARFAAKLAEIVLAMLEGAAAARPIES